MTLKKAAQHTMIHGIGKVISTILGILALAIITRYLGTAGYGQYTTTMAFLQFFAIFVDMGLSLVMVQLISNPQYEEQKIINNLITFRLITAIVFLSFAPLAVLFFPYAEIVKQAVFITTISFVFIALTQVLTGIFQKHLSMQKVAISEVAGRIALLLGLATVIYFDLGFLWLMTTVVLGSLIHFLFLFSQTKRFVSFSFAFDKEIWKLITKKSWPIALSIVFNLIYLKADIIILSLFHSDTAVGIYGASYRVVEVLTVIPMMLMGIMLPILTRTYTTNDTKNFISTMQHAFNALAILIIPIVFGAFVIGNQLMAFIAGDAFAVSGEPLKIIVFGLAAIFLGNVFAHTIIAIDKQKQMIIGYAITAALTFIGYLIFIPKYSYFGAAYMTVFSEILIGLISFSMVYYFTKIRLSLKTLAKSIISAFIMAMILYFIRDYSVLLTIPFGILVYFTSLFLIKGISKEFVLSVIKRQP